MKTFIAGLFGFVTEIVMSIPFWVIRKSYLRIFISNLGNESYIMKNVDIRKPKNINIGNNVVINKRCLLDGRGGSLIIGNNTDIAQEVNIWTLSHDIKDPEHKSFGKDVTIGDHCWIGARASILPGVNVGKGAVIGTCAVVTKDVPPRAVVVGNPARQVGERDNPLNYTLQFKPWFS